MSDEELWLYVMNNWYLNTSTCQEDYDKEEAWFESLPDDKKQAVKTESWQNIFDITLFNNGFYIKGRYVQATFWELRAEQIRKVQFFKAR